MDLGDKLKPLAGAARYDASCASSGSRRGPASGRIGTSVPSGICHSFTEDGRCVSLLKVLFTNHCIYDCSTCVNRSSNDIPRAAFRVSELVDLTVSFYRRNFIEGLFLSSGTIDAVNIPERKNTALHLNMMPRRYWKFLPEKRVAAR